MTTFKIITSIVTVLFVIFILYAAIWDTKRLNGNSSLERQFDKNIKSLEELNKSFQNVINKLKE